MDDKHNNVIVDITNALLLRDDERVIIRGTFAQFQAAAAKLWENAPLGDDAAPESCRTLAVTFRTEAA